MRMLGWYISIELMLILRVIGWRPYNVLITNHTAESYSSIVRLNATFTNSKKFNFYVEFLDTVRNPFIHTGLYFESSAGKYDLEIMNRTIDMCKFYKNKRYEPILQVIFKLFEETTSHWQRSCPLTKGVFYLKDVELNVEKLPPFFPEKNGIYDSVVLQKKIPLFRLKVFFDIYKTFRRN